MGQNKNNDAKKQHKDYCNLISYDKGVIHNLFAVLIKRMLKNQKSRVATTPDVIMSKLRLSISDIIGERTIMPKTTWPALSKMLDVLKSSSLPRIGFLGKGGFIKVI